MTLPAFHVEGAVVYLRNDLPGAPLCRLDELSQLIGEGCLRRDLPLRDAPCVPGYRPWATVTTKEKPPCPA